MTEEEHTFLKILATERGYTMTRMILEAMRTYIKEKT